MNKETAEAYIVQCKAEGTRRPWTDYSSPATLEECETIKARAEARNIYSVNGQRIIYRITAA